MRNHEFAKIEEQFSNFKDRGLRFAVKKFFSNLSMTNVCYARREFENQA